MQKSVLKEAALRYKLYSLVLEGKYEQDYYDLLSEAGFFQKLISALKSGPSGELFDSAAAQKELPQVQAKISSAVKDLQNLVTKAYPEDTSDQMNAKVASMLDPILRELQVDVEKGKELNRSFAAKQGKSATAPGANTIAAPVTQQAEVQSGESIKNIEQAAASAVAAAESGEGKKIESEKVAAASKQPNKFIDELVKKSGVEDKGLVQRIVRALLDKNLIKSQVTVTAENKKRSFDKIVLGTRGRIIGEIDLNYVRKAQKALVESPESKQFERILDTNEQGGSDYDSLLKNLKDFMGRTPNFSFDSAFKEDAQLEDKLNQILKKSSKSVDNLKKDLEKSNTKIDKTSKASKKYVDVLNRLGPDFASNKKDVIKILDVLSTFFLVAEGKDQKSNILSERWQRLAGIL